MTSRSTQRFREYGQYSRMAVVAITAVLVLLQFRADAQEPVVDKPDDILIIVNKAVNIDQTQVDELKAIFLKRKANWSDGTKAIPINAPEGSKIREAFRRLVTGMTRSREQSFWQTQMIKHGTNRPPEFANPLKAVFKLRGAVSYVYRSDYRKGVAKIILVLR